MKPRRWALIERLVPVKNPDKPVSQAANEELKEKVESEQEALLAKLNELEVRSLGRT